MLGYYSNWGGAFFGFGAYALGGRHFFGEFRLRHRSFPLWVTYFSRIWSIMLGKLPFMDGVAVFPSINATLPSLLFYRHRLITHLLTHIFFHLGVFFLFGAGRLALIRSQPHLAISYYTQAMHAQKQYRNLHYISYWEMAISYLALWDLSGSLGCWRVLEAEGNVSLLLSFRLSVSIFRVFSPFFLYLVIIDLLTYAMPCLI